MGQLIDKIWQNAIQPFLVFLFAWAVVLFIYGLVEFIYGADNQEKRANGKKHIMWGLIGMSIMLSAYAIKEVIENFISSF